MTLRILAAVSCLSCLLALSRVDAQTHPAPHAAQSPFVPHPTYVLWHVPVADASPAQSVWELRMQPTKNVVSPPAPDDVFQSLAAPQLRDWVSRLPADSSIIGFLWLGAINSESNIRMLPPTPLQSEITEFQKFCESKKVSMGMVIGGG